MGIESTNGGSGNGNASGPHRATVWVLGEGPVHDALGQIVVVMLTEAVARRCSEIVVGLGEDCCPVHFIRGNEQLEMDSMPVRLFDPLKDRIAQMCGNKGCQGEGTFISSLKKSKTSSQVGAQVQVSVVFGDSSLRLTISDVRDTP